MKHLFTRAVLRVVSIRFTTTLSVMLVFGALSAYQTRASEPQHGTKWVATWAQSMTSNYLPIHKTDPADRDFTMSPPPVARNFTVRQTVRVSVGGHGIRIQLSNYYGLKSLHVATAHIALQAGGAKNLSTIVGETDRTLTFGGKTSVTIAPGQVVTSDPVVLDVPKLSHVVVSLYFKHRTVFSEIHPVEDAATTAIVAGNAVAAITFARCPQLYLRGRHQQRHIYFLTGVDVLAPISTRVIAAIGASITDGVYATSLANPWPDVLASIANSRPNHAPVAVIDEGISGNELTTDQVGSPTAGMSVLKRFERDVIDQPGITDVIVMIGGNDVDRGIGVSGLPTGASAGDMIASLRMLADVAHAHHLRVYVGTITPFAGYTGKGWYTPAKEAVRERVNHWIHHTHVFDGVIPFAEAVRGPYTPSKLAAEQTLLPPGLASVCAGDSGLHPNDRGYKVMGTVAYNALFDAHLVLSAPCH